MKFEIYRRIDLIVFGLLMIFSSLASLFIFSNHSFQFYISFTNLILFIVLVRWNYLGLLPYVINQIIISFVQVNFFDTDWAVVFVVNAFGCIFLPIFCFMISKYVKNIRMRPILLLLLYSLLFILIGLGRALGLMVLKDFNFLGNFLFYIINQEIFSLIIGMILLMLLKNIDNLVVNVKDYILELQNGSLEESKCKEDKNGRVQKQKFHRNDIKKD